MNQFETNNSLVPQPISNEKTSGQFDQKYWGEQFKNILTEQKSEFEQRFELLKSIAGENVAKATRDSNILKGGLKKFITLPNFPEDKKQEIWKSLALLEMHDPLVELTQYNHEQDPIMKNMLAESYNEKIHMYLTSIQPLIESLNGIVPDDMVHELWARNAMFLTPLTIHK